MVNNWYVPTTKHIPPDAIKAAQTIETATLYEANQKRGSLDPLIRQIVPGLSLCGSAITVRCQSGDNLTLHAAVARANPGDIIVADVGGYADAGHWGEILTVAAKARGIAGLVINGGVRDVAALEVHQFPVFARAISMKATTKQIRGVINHQITCGGIEIQPGDLVVGDADGVVAIAHEAIADVLAMARQREAGETDMMDRLREGALTLDLLDLRPLIDSTEWEHHAQ